jgi:uncharacterized protein (TIGR03435 family)
MKIAALILCVSAAWAQPAFETASIRPHEGPLTTISGFSESGPRVRLVGYTVFGLVMEAYGLKRYEVSLPPKVDDTFYDIVAKAEGDAPRTRAEFRAMLRTLLAERLQLRVHREQREMPVYALVVGKSGAKLKKSAPAAEAHFLGSVNGRNQVVTANHMTIKDLAQELGNFFGVDRPVLDRTGLEGEYDVKFEATPAWQRDSDVGDLSVFTAVQEQLGLKLEPAKAPVEVLVVDHVEKPSAN